MFWYKPLNKLHKYAVMCITEVVTGDKLNGARLTAEACTPMTYMHKSAAQITKSTPC